MTFYLFDASSIQLFYAFISSLWNVEFIEKKKKNVKSFRVLDDHLTN